MNILITGANRGLGKALTHIFSAHQHSVTALIRSRAHASALRTDIPECAVAIADVTHPGELSKLPCFDSAELDILINNAGTGGSGRNLSETTAEEIEQQLSVHCRGAFNVAKQFTPALMRAKRPLIINISSRLGSLQRNAEGEFASGAFSYSYRIAKAAQNMLTLCLAQELGEKGITVCALNPGRLLTDSGAADAHLTAEQSAEKIYQLITSQPLINGHFYCIENGTSRW